MEAKARARRAAGMRRYWNERARENAFFYVDTTCDYEAPDLERFFETGRAIVDHAYTNAPARSERTCLAIEIGCGLGRVSRALRDHFDRVIGIDVSEEMVQRARDLVREPGIEFIVGDGMTLRPVPDGSADYVVTFTVLQHLPNRDAIIGYLGEAARVLREGGVLAAQWNGDTRRVRFWIRGRWLRLRRALHLGFSDPRAASQFLGTPVPVSFIGGELERLGLTVRATMGEGTLFSWIWAEKHSHSRDGMQQPPTT